MKRLIKASKVTSIDLIKQMPDELIYGLNALSYPIGVEQCGYRPTLEQAKEFVKDRTIRNKKSNWFYCLNAYSGVEKMIDDLFDFVADLGVSVQQLTVMARFMRRHDPFAKIDKDDYSQYPGFKFFKQCESAYERKYFN